MWHLVKVMQSYLLSEHVTGLHSHGENTEPLGPLAHAPLSVCSVQEPSSLSLQPLQSLGFGTQVISLVGDLPAKWMICQRTTQTTKGRGVLVCCRDYWRSLWCHTPCQGMSCKCLKIGEVNPNLFLYSFRVRSFSWTLNLLKRHWDTGTARLKSQKEQEIL